MCMHGTRLMLPYKTKIRILLIRVFRDMQLSYSRTIKNNIGRKCAKYTNGAAGLKSPTDASNTWVLYSNSVCLCQ